VTVTKTTATVSAVLSSVGTLQCAAFAIGHTVAAVEEIVLQNYQATVLSGDALSVTVPGLIPATPYNIYCSTASRQGVQLSLINTWATRTHVETLCCKTVLVSLAERTVVANMDVLNGIALTLDSTPSTNISVLVTVVASDSSITSTIPSTVFFSSMQPKLSALLSIPAAATKVIGWATVEVHIQGPASREYNLQYQGKLT
jgi:hypothetical protein